MTTTEDRDIIGEVIAEDAAERQVARWQLKGFIPGVDGLSKAVFKPWVVQAKDYDELRQQLADVSHERDLLRSSCGKKDQALRNMLGAFDTPIARRKINGEFPGLAIESAHEALDLNAEPSAEVK